MAPEIIVAYPPSDPVVEESGLFELTEGAIMTALQASLLGMMLAWMPSLFLLACIVRDIRATRDQELD